MKLIIEKIQFTKIPAAITFQKLKQIIAQIMGALDGDAITVNGKNKEIDNPQIVKFLGNIRTEWFNHVDLTTFLKLYAYSKGRVEYAKL